MAYKVTLKKRAIKALEKMNEPYYSNIKEAIYRLAEKPRPAGYKKLKGRDGYRIRVADYRIIYDIFDDVLIVDVIDLGHRKGECKTNCVRS
jgi:mRNA interferase RelE/StbE